MTENQNDIIIKTNDFKLKIDSKGTILNYGNLLIKKGDFVTIEGPNGSGKSTFLKLLVNEAGEYCSLESGSIFIDGKNLFDYDSDVLKRSVVVRIDQEESFKKGESAFHALIRPAIVASCDVDNPKEMKKQIKDLALQYYKDYLINFYHDPNSDISKYKSNPKCDYRFMYLQSASSLSGGQQKMIHIMQGIIKAKAIGCKIMLMDEPLNNLDKENKKILLKMIHELRQIDRELTILLITHCKVFPNVNTVLRITNNGNENSAELIRLDECVKPYDCLD